MSLEEFYTFSAGLFIIWITQKIVFTEKKGE